MKPTISIIDYGAGNIASVRSMFRAIGANAVLVTTPEEVMAANRLILPGVGHFDHGMAELQSRGLISAMEERVCEQGVPLLGICLGAQLIARGSAEGNRPGLGWVSADVVAFDRTRMESNLRVPHMGWAETWVAPQAIASGNVPDAFNQAITADARFYYVHSFHLSCDDENQAMLRAYHGYEFAAGVISGNILGLQFHPEKSHRFGKAVLEAFLRWEPEVASRQRGGDSC